MMLLAMATMAIAGGIRAATTQLYAMAENVQLGTVNPLTGAFTGIGGIYGSQEAQAQQLSALDNERGIFYIIGYNLTISAPNLLGWSLSDGSIVVNRPLPFGEMSFIGVGQQMAYDPVTDQILVGGQMGSSGAHCVGFINIATGAFHNITCLPGTYLDVLGGSSAFDPVSGTFLIMLGTTHNIFTFAVNVRTANVTKLRQDPAAGLFLDTLNWDIPMQSLVGMGITVNSTGGYVRTVLRMDPITGKYKTVGEVPAFTIISGGISALNINGRILYWIGQKTGASMNDPFYIIGVDIDTAAVSSSAKLCPNDAACPWSLQYNNM